MAISAGNYIIRSAIGEDTVLLTSGGSKSNGAEIISGALTEEDNRCYWKAAVVSTNYNKIYNINSGTKTGYIMAKTVADGKNITQGAYVVATGAWLAVYLYDEFAGDAFESGVTYYERTGEEGSYVYTPTTDEIYNPEKTYYIRRKTTLHGKQIEIVYLRTYSNSNLYLTVPDDGGNLYLSEFQEGSANQEFYFELSTYFDKNLATPKNLTTSEGVDYVVDATSDPGTFNVRWKCSKTTPIYEQRYRTRMYDESGNPQDWLEWSDWTMITATKKTVGKDTYMQSGTAIPTPSVDNENYMQADIEVQERITSAAKASAYNKTDKVTHGAVVDAIIRKWIVPSLTVTLATCHQYGLGIEYSSSYAVAGNTIEIVSIYNGTEKLVENYILTSQDFQGEVLVSWDAISRIPDEHDVLDITVKITESNSVVSFMDLYSVAVDYDSGVGLVFTPSYSLTNRMTIEGMLNNYNSVECYIRQKDLLGNDVWTAIDEIKKSDSSHRYFEITPAFGTTSTIMWVVSSLIDGRIQWGYRRDVLNENFIINTRYYTWNWVDDNKNPHVYILKYKAGSIMQPTDVVTLPSNKFVTTGRDYPIFRYTKSVDRQLDIDGVILNDENEIYCTKVDAETLIPAYHAVYRQPNGKWYQVALKSVAFTKEQMYTSINIQQEAETR